MAASEEVAVNHRSQNMPFARVLLATNLKASLMLRGSFAMQVVFMALNNLTFFVFWWVLMKRVPEVRGWRLGDVQVLFGVVATSVGLISMVAGGLAHLGRCIDGGQFDAVLTQPKPVLVYALGMRSNASGLGDVLSGIAFIAFSGQVSWRGLPAAALAILASGLVFMACGIVFFSLAFWLGKVEGFARQLWELLITFSLYPEPLFGNALRLVLFTVLPAGFVGYVPARLAHNPSAADAVVVSVAACTCLVVAALVFERGLRRYSSGSRFSAFG